MNYSDLIAGKSTAGSIKRWVNNASIDAELVLTEAQAWIYNLLRVRQMIGAATTGSMTVGQDYITLPSDYLEAMTVHITGIHAARLDRKPLHEIENLFAYDGSGARVNAKPRLFHTTALRMEFESPPDLAYPYRIRMYGKPANLSGANETNFLCTDYPTLLRSSCMMKANEFLKDDTEKEWWGKQAMGQIEMANAQSDAERSGTFMQVEPD